MTLIGRMSTDDMLPGLVWIFFGWLRWREDGKTRITLVGRINTDDIAAVALERMFGFFLDGFGAGKREEHG